MKFTLGVYSGTWKESFKMLRRRSVWQRGRNKNKNTT